MVTQADIIRAQTTVPTCCICGIRATQLTASGIWLCNRHFAEHRKRVEIIKRTRK